MPEKLLKAFLFLLTTRFTRVFSLTIMLLMSFLCNDKRGESCCWSLCSCFCSATHSVSRQKLFFVLSASHAFLCQFNKKHLKSRARKQVLRKEMRRKNTRVFRVQWVQLLIYFTICVTNYCLTHFSEQ